MSFMVRLTDEELQKVADKALRGAMPDLPFEGVEVASLMDWSDEPSLQVVAKVGPGVPPLPGAVFSRIHGAVHEAFLKEGEERFPYFRLRRADDVPAGEDDPTAEAQ